MSSLPILSIFCLTVGIISLILGGFIVSKNYHSVVHRLYLAISIAVSIWMISFGFLGSKIFSYGTSLVLAKYVFVGVIFIPTLAFHFVVEFLGDYIPPNKKRGLKIIYTFALIFLALLFTSDRFISGINNYSWGYYPRGGFIHVLYVCFAALTAAYAVYLLWKGLASVKEKSGKTKKYFQLRTILVAYACLALSSSDFLQNWGVDFLPMGSVFVSLYSILICYAIFKHEFLGISIIIKKTFFYSTLALTLSIFYVLAIFLTNGILVENSVSEGQNLLPRVNPFVISSLLTAISSLFLGFFVYLQNPQRKLYQLWLYFNLVVAVWGVGGIAIGMCQNPNISLWLWRITYAFGVMWMPVFFLHFACEFCEIKKNKWLKIVYIFHMLIFPLIFSKYFYAGTKLVFNSFYYATPLSIIHYAIMFLIWSVIFAYGLFLFLKALKLANERKRKHLGYTFLAIVIGVIGGSLNFLPFFGIYLYPWGNFTVPLYSMIITFAILKYQLLDIRLIIKKTLMYSFFVFLISVTYLGAVYIFYKIFLSTSVSRSSLNFGAFSVLVIAILFKPLELLLHRFLERRFFKGTIGEISEQKERLETELGRRERLKSVGILAAGMAHEIKNPLTSIKTFAEYLPKKYDDPEFREKFSRIVVDEVDRVNNIVKQLLEFSKPSSLDLKPILISELLEQTVSLLNNNLLRYKIELIKDYDAYAMILADRNQLKQAFLNIFLNSIQSMPNGGKLCITARAELDGQVKITVSDTGSGISVEQLTHVFDPFYTTKEDGTGLGLAIVHGIITKHGGKIQMESMVGKGTTVNVTLKSQS